LRDLKIVKPIAFLALLAACAGSHTAATRPTPLSYDSVIRRGPAYLDRENPWPQYVAINYRSAHPRLSARNERELRHILASVEPCQRPLVRYAFPGHSSSLQFVVFFAAAPGQWRHVLDQQNAHYKPEEGAVFPMPQDPKHSLADDIRWEPCPAGNETSANH
jgi:hypothetical protein